MKPSQRCCLGRGCINPEICDSLGHACGDPSCDCDQPSGKWKEIDAAAHRVAAGEAVKFAEVYDAFLDDLDELTNGQPNKFLHWMARKLGLKKGVTN